MPVGGILPFFGDINRLPSNWAVCDGKIHDGIETPNLSGRFIVGATSNRNSGHFSFGTIGGVSEVILEADQLPEHDHNIRDAGHTHVLLHGGAAHGTPDQDPKNSVFRHNEGDNIRSVTEKSSSRILTTPLDAPTPIKILPPYVALHYIIRIK